MCVYVAFSDADKVRDVLRDIGYVSYYVHNMSLDLIPLLLQLCTAGTNLILTSLGENA